MIFVEKYSNINDENLDTMVQGIQRQHPGVGLRMLQGYLKSQGIVLQRERVRMALVRTDPSGCYERWRQAVHRRKYSVPTTRALWHIDGNHKLIR